MSDKETLSKHESFIQDCRKAFAIYDKNDIGYIDYFDLKDALEKMDIQFKHGYVYFKMIQDMQKGNSQEAHAENKCSLDDFLKLVKKCKIKKEDNSEDVLDAYVALGGDEDGGGNIDADKLIDTIKNEMEMTIDIENLIKEIDEDGSGEIEFGEFEQLLEGTADNPELKAFGHWFIF